MNQNAKNDQTAAKPAGESRRWTIIATFVAAIAIIGIFAVVVSVTGGTGAAARTETGAVTVTGDALADMVDGASSADDPAIGRAAPALSGVDFDNRPVAFTPGGSATLLVFLAHWCSNCQAEVPRLVDWWATGTADIDVFTIITATDKIKPNYPPSAWMTAEAWPTDWPVLVDSATLDAARAYGTTGFPYLVLVGDSGTVLWRHSGQLGTDDLVAQIDAALTR